MSKTNLSTGDQAQTILGRLESNAKLFPNRIAIQQTNGPCVTYSDLIKRAQRIGQNLTARGFEPGDRALLLSKPGIDAVSWVLGVMYAGGVSVIADPGMGQQVFEERVKAALPKWALVDDAIILLSALPPLMALARRKTDIPDMPSNRDINIVHHGNHPLLNLKYPNFKTLLNDSEKIPSIKQKTEQEAIIVFTSGTTSKPKGVVHTVGSLSESLSLIGKIINPKDGAVFYTELPYFLLIGIGLGVTVIVETSKSKPKSMLRNLRKSKATLIFGPPGEILPVIEFCLSQKIKFPATIDHIYLGSAPIYKSFLKKLEPVIAPTTAITCIYGMTEILPIATIDGRKKMASRVSGDLLGDPISKIKTQVAYDGELIVSGPHMCKNYLGDATSLAQIHTGDIVHFENDQLIMDGRNKDMILKGDYNIYPALYEPIIESIPGVSACAMVGLYDDDKADEKIIIAIESDGTRELSKSYIERNLRSGTHSIDSHAFPDNIIFMKLPRSGRQSKIDKSAIKLKVIHNA